MTRFALVAAGIAACFLPGCGEKSPTEVGWDFPKPGVSVCRQNCVLEAPPGYLRFDTLSTAEPLDFLGLANGAFVYGQIYRQKLGSEHQFTEGIVYLWFVVAETGKTTHIALTGKSGTPYLDRLVVDVMSYALWHKPTYNGIPIGIAFMVSLTVPT